MAAAHRIVTFLGRMDKLTEESHEGGGGGERISAQAEIFRLSGIVEGILTFEGDKIWQDLEKLGVSEYVLKDKLKETWKELTKSKIPRNTSALVRRGQVSVVFKEYMELPELVVRQRVLSYLTDPIDELNMARAIPSEVRHLSGPLDLIRLKAIFPILMNVMNRNLLTPKDVINLSASDPYIHVFIRKHFDTILCKDDKYLAGRENWLGIKDIPMSPNFGVQIIPPVCIDEFSEETWSLLSICGSQILHCIILLSGQRPEWIKSILETMPILRTICILGGSKTDELNLKPPTNPERYPNLPFLKNLMFCHILYRPERIGLLEKYEGQLELLNMDQFENPEMPISWPYLSSLTLTFTRASSTIKTVIQFIGSITTCPIKMLNLTLFVGTYSPRRFRRMLSLISNNWGESLEVLSLSTPGLQPNEKAFHWNSNLGFPKLKELFWEHCYSFSKDSEFLLWCPVLQELSFFQSESYWPKKVELFMELYNDKDRMLKSNVWKLFPKLKQVQFNDWKKNSNGIWHRQKVVVTRQECLAAELCVSARSPHN